MVISDSTFRYLGRDWNSSYGVSWSKGSTGSVTRLDSSSTTSSAFTPNGRTSLQITTTHFSHNSLYGIDPHSDSTAHAIIEDNTSSYNGRHGIIFSDHVTAGIVRNNITNGNGLNGIMMDEFSTGNVIENNSVGGQPLRRHRDGQLANNTVSGKQDHEQPNRHHVAREHREHDRHCTTRSCTTRRRAQGLSLSRQLRQAATAVSGEPVASPRSSELAARPAARLVRVVTCVCEAAEAPTHRTELASGVATA